jgi:NAD(P)-dependent dehydrogenase (short-subunit alcohol dehydrogenase family)
MHGKPAVVTGPPRSRFSVDGAVVVITGASSGLGAHLVDVFASEGAKVVAAARRRERLDDLVARTGGTVLPVAADVTSEVDRVRLVESARAAFGPIDVLVNNAGAIGAVVPAEREDPGLIERTLAVNLVAPARLAALAYDDMKTRGGSIVGISSISAMVGIGRIPQAAYAASKAGLVGLTRELAVQWARDRIRVNVVAAGFFESELTAPMYATEKLARWVESNTPLPSKGSPGDFAGAVLLLASPAGAYITGQTIVVDGGWTAR